MNTPATTLSRGDRIGMYLTVGLGVVGAIAVVWTAVARLIEVLTADAIPVLVPFVGERAELPLGPGGAMIPVDVDQAIVHVTDPAVATTFALVAQPIVWGLTLLVGIALLCAVCLQLARGRAFATATVRIIWTGTIVLAVGWLVSHLFTSMGVNGTLSAVSDYSYEGTLFETDLVGITGLVALGAVGSAFQIGHRLQRDSEGLI